MVARKIAVIKLKELRDELTRGHPMSRLKCFALGFALGSAIFSGITYAVAQSYFENHVIAGGLNATTGVPFKVDSTGALYVTNS